MAAEWQASTIITVWPGATARQVEKLVADPIEDAMSGIEAIRKIDTTSYVNYCVTQISIQDQYADADYDASGVHHTWWASSCG